MANTLELRRKRAALVEEARGILNKAEAEKRELTGEENAQYEARMSDVDKMKVQIDREERMSVLESEMKESRTEPEKPGLDREDRGGAEKPLIATEQYANAFRRWMRFGNQGLTSEQRSLLEKETRADNVVGTAGAGGYTVPQGFSFNLGEALKTFGGARQTGAEVINTAAGNDIPWPSLDDTANVGELLAEVAASAEQNMAFTSVTMKAFVYGSKAIPVSYELLQDSAFNIEQLVTRVAATRIGRITNTHFTTGTGTGQPQGIVTASTAGKTGATGQTTSVIYNDLVDLEHSVDPAYRQTGARWMFHDSTLKALKKLVDSQNRPLWQAGLTVREPDSLMGYPYVINQDVATMAANAKSIIFGNFADYKIRDVNDVTLYRIVEPYVLTRKVVFVAYSRHDGRSIATGGAPWKHYANSAT